MPSSKLTRRGAWSMHPPHEERILERRNPMQKHNANPQLDTQSRNLLSRSGELHRATSTLCRCDGHGKQWESEQVGVKMAATRLLLNVCLRKAIHQTTRDRTPETLVAASHWFVVGSYFQTFLVIYLLYTDDLPGHLHTQSILDWKNSIFRLKKFNLQSPIEDWFFSIVLPIVCLVFDWKIDWKK